MSAEIPSVGKKPQPPAATTQPPVSDVDTKTTSDVTPDQEARPSLSMDAPELSAKIESALQLGSSPGVRPSPQSSLRAQELLALQKGTAEVAGNTGIKPLSTEAAVLSEQQVGAFLGRLASGVLGTQEGALLDAYAAAGHLFEPFKEAIEAARNFGIAMPISNQRVNRISAGMELVRRLPFSATRDDWLDRATEIISQADHTPTVDYAPLHSIKDGDVEALVLQLSRQIGPHLAEALARNHPHIPNPSQLPAVQETVQAIRQAQGAFLSGFNVMMVVHQTGGMVPWLQTLHSELGLIKEDYLGVSVPYSGSAIAIERLNLEGFETSHAYDPRSRTDAVLRHLQINADAPDFDELKETEISEAIETMLGKHSDNGKQILVVDDGGYVCQVLRKRFAADESKFTFVEWATRGIRQFEKISNPKFALVAAAESAPKTKIEPPLIAAAIIEHFQILMNEHHGALRGRKVLCVGYGNIGRAVALALKGAGCRVFVHDESADALKQIKRDGLKPAPNLAAAVKNKDGILAITGTNSLPPAVIARADANTVIASGSSADIESRDEHGAGDCGQDTLLARVHIGPKAERSRGMSRSARSSPQLRVFDQHLRKGLAAYGLDVEIEAPTVAASGFVLNLSRRARNMAQGREELIFMNVTEAMAQAATTTTPGKHLVDADRDKRTEDIFQRVHPEHYEFASRFSVVRKTRHVS